MRRLLVVLALAVMAGCQKPAEEPQAATPPKPPPPPPQQLADQLRVYGWEDYLTDEVIEDFTQEFKVSVFYEIFDSNEEMLERIRQGEAWDVVMPSDYAVRIMRSEGLALELNAEVVTNLKNIAPRFQKMAFDPEGRYAVPFYWGSSGLGFDRTTLPTAPDSWAILFDPVAREPVKGKITLLDDMREVFAGALLAGNKSPNSLDPTDLAEARDRILKLLPDLKGFDSLDYARNLGGEDVALAHGWGGEFAQALADNEKLGYALPKEGYLIFIDTLVIPKTAQSKFTAETFMNFLLRPEVAAKLVNANRFATCNEPALKSVSPDILNGPTYTAPSGVKTFILDDLGQAASTYQSYWQEIKKAWDARQSQGSTGQPMAESGEPVLSAPAEDVIPGSP